MLTLAPVDIAAFSSARGLVAATPDSSGCWKESHDFTFEVCCVAWSDADVGVGDPNCWTLDYSYERCCLPRATPRSFFSCEERGPIWQRFRREVALSRNLASSGLLDILRMPVSNCFLGSLVAVLLHVYVVSASEETRPDSSSGYNLFQAYNRASDWLKVMLRSPISMDEVLSSGWPVPKAVLTLQTLPSLASLVASSRDPAIEELISWPEESQRFVLSVHHAVLEGQRARLDLPLAWLAAEATRAGHRVGAAASPLAAAGAATASCWSAAFTLRAVDIPRAAIKERFSLAREAARLLRIGDEVLRHALLVPGPGGTPAMPLARLLRMRDFGLVVLLHGLQTDAVVFVDPLQIIHELVEYGLPLHLVPFAEHLQGGSGAGSDRGTRQPVQPLELHVLPMDDSVSNNVRAYKRPFCYERTFLRLVAAAARLSALAGNASTAPWPRRSFRFWEVGANLGDCTLWAVAVLSAAAADGVVPLVDATGFEPMPPAAAAFRRSAASLEATRRGFVAPRVRVRVKEVAIGDRRGIRNIGMPLHSVAESTFNNCSRYYELDRGCKQLTIATETIDGLLAPRSDGIRLSPRRLVGVVDLMKIHVQGDELRVLRGARRALAAGRICVVTVRSFAFEMAEGSPEAITAELDDLLAGYHKVLVNATGAALPLGAPGARLADIIAAARNTDSTLGMEAVSGVAGPLHRIIVAWHEGALCWPGGGRGSLVVAAARALWRESSGSIIAVLGTQPINATQARQILP